MTATCAVTNNGAFCWGARALGQLGDGGFSDASVPSSVLTMTPFEQITARGTHSCGLTASGNVLCWGSNREGQLGPGSFSLTMTHVPVSSAL